MDEEAIGCESALTRGACGEVEMKDGGRGGIVEVVSVRWVRLWEGWERKNVRQREGTLVCARVCLENAHM